MSTQIVKTDDWAKRNVETLPSGEFVVRQSITRDAYTVALSSSTKLFGGFTILNPITNLVTHYVVHFETTVKLSILDDVGVVIYTFDYGTTVEPEDVTYAIVENELVIACPGLPTLWGLVGSGVILAVKQDSVNPGTTAIDVPSGLCVGWAGRCVIADEEAVYFSDALYPRTYVAENGINPPGGVIFALHVNKGGALIAVTSDGVYALPEDAAASGQVVIGIWSKLTDYQCTEYRNTVSCSGRVWGLVDDGVKLIDEPNSTVVPLSEPAMSRGLIDLGIERIAFDDYRMASLLSSDDKLYVCIAPYVCCVDLKSKFSSWYTFSTYNPITFAAVLQEQDGSELFLADAGTGVSRLMVRNGNFDPYDNCIGVIAAIVKPQGMLQEVLRSVAFRTDGQVAVYFEAQNQVVYTEIASHAVVIGTHSWDSGSTYEEPRLRNERLQCALRGDTFDVKVGVSVYPAQIPNEVKLTFKGPGRNRP